MAAVIACRLLTCWAAAHPPFGQSYCKAQGTGTILSGCRGVIVPSSRKGSCVPSLPDRIGPYQPLERIGAGGMGTVYYALHPRSGLPLAIKVLHADYADDEAHRKRFAREAAALRRVDGPHLIPLVDADPEAARPWLATPYVPGNTLHQHVQQYGRLTRANVMTFAVATAHALACIHRAGIAHRDLKPQNVILAVDGPRVVDFGIAHLLDADAVTPTRVTTGTPGWMAPEQLVAGTTTTASDVFVWGVLVAFAASGHHPYGPSTGISYRMAQGVSPDLEDVPKEVVRQVEAALSLDPADRPAAADLAASLANAYGSQGTALFPTMAYTRVLKDAEFDEAVVPPFSRWDIAPPERDLSRVIPKPAAPPPFVQVPPSDLVAPHRPDQAHTGGARLVPAGQAPNPYRAPTSVDGERRTKPRRLMSKLVLTGAVSSAVIAWSSVVSTSGGSLDDAARQPRPSATATAVDPPSARARTSDPRPTELSTPPPSIGLGLDSPSATATWAGVPQPRVHPTVDASGVPFAKERERGEFAPLYDPNPAPSEFTGGMNCDWYRHTTDPDPAPYCVVAFYNGTREPKAFVCTAYYRDDQSDDPDFRFGDPEPDTGTFAFRTPVIPARYAMDLNAFLPSGKLPSMDHPGELECTFAKL